MGDFAELLEFLDNSPHNIPIDDGEEEDISVDELKYRIGKNWAKLQQLKEQAQLRQGNAITTPQLVQDLSRRNKMARCQNSVLQNMLTMMENGTAKGFVYGIIQDDGKTVGTSSDNLRLWWREEVCFDWNGPAAISKYEAEQQPPQPCGETSNGSTSTYSNLKEISDATLGSIISALMQHCEPPQRKFPFDRKVAPLWWPSGNEEWWPKLGLLDEVEPPPPYRKPHDLKKTWKVCVLYAIIRHMMPDEKKLLRLVRRSRSLQKKLSPDESRIWSGVVRQETSAYFELHPDEQRSPVSSADAFLFLDNNSGAYAGTDGTESLSRMAAGSENQGNQERSVDWVPMRVLPDHSGPIYPSLSNLQKINFQLYKTQAKDFQRAENNQPIASTLGTSVAGPSNPPDAISEHTSIYDLMDFYDRNINQLDRRQETATTIVQASSSQAEQLQQDVVVNNTYFGQGIEMMGDGLFREAGNFSVQQSSTTFSLDRMSTEPVIASQMHDIALGSGIESLLDAPDTSLEFGLDEVPDFNFLDEVPPIAPSDLCQSPGCSNWWD